MNEKYELSEDDYGLWNLRKDVTYNEAACILLNLNPAKCFMHTTSETSVFCKKIQPDQRSQINVTRDILEEARKRGELEETTPTGPYAWMAMPFVRKISATSLKAYADKYSFRPQFLFPKKNINKLNIETFIRNLRIALENDSEISIQETGRKAKTYTCESIGFRNSDTKAWKGFRNTFHEVDHTFRCGKSSQIHCNNRDYNAKHKLLSEINKKLVIFIECQYQVKIPNDYKLYELCQDKEPGTYRFKFHVEDGLIKSKYDNLTKEALLEKLKELSDKYKTCNVKGEEIPDSLQNDFQNAILEAKEKGISNEQLEEFIPYTHKEEIRYCPSENMAPEQHD